MGHLDPFSWSRAYIPSQINLHQDEHAWARAYCPVPPRITITRNHPRFFRSHVMPNQPDLPMLRCQYRLLAETSPGRTKLGKVERATLCARPMPDSSIPPHQTWTF